MKTCSIEVLEGPLAGQKYRLREGLRIGRTVGDVLIDDPKMSSLQAQVELDHKGNLVLVDCDSANGLRIHQQKVKRVAMMLGVIFWAGQTQFKVIEVSHELQPLVQPAVQEKKKDLWRDYPIHHIPKTATRNLDDVMGVEAFRPALQLDFLEGIQIEHQILLGYGPRRFGSDVLDIELQESICPPLAFELLPQEGEALFQTQYPKLVLLNGQSVSSALLKEGDQIRVGQTLIQVSFAS